MKVYCKDCKKRDDIPTYMYDDYDWCPMILDDWYAPEHEARERCSILNKNNDCPNFEQKSWQVE